jgi:hypothetical protein
MGKAVQEIAILRADPPGRTRRWGGAVRYCTHRKYKARRLLVLEACRALRFTHRDNLCSRDEPRASMARRSARAAVRSASVAALFLAWTAAWAGSPEKMSPEEEINRLNRVRQTLFEELVKTRAEAATARTELEAVSKARDQAEAELGRLKQEMTSRISTPLPPNANAPAASRPASAPQVNPRPKKALPGMAAKLPAKNASSLSHRSIAAPVRPSTTGSVASSSSVPAERLPSALRLQDLR